MKTKRFVYDELKPPIHFRPGTSDEILINQMFLKKQEYLFPKLDAKIVFDIGANIGIASIILCGIYPQATVHAFEPEPENFELLEMNVSHLPNISLHKCALDNHSGDAFLYGSDDPTNLGGFSLAIKPEKESVTGSRVQIVRMAPVCTKFGHPDIIKIDCEGSEYNILTDIPNIEEVAWIAGELHGVKDFELLARLQATHEISTVRSFGDKVWHFHAANRKKLFTTAKTGLVED